MPKVLSSPKLPPNREGGRRNFRLSPLEIGVAILVAMGGIYLLYVLLSGLFGGGDGSAPAGGGVPADLNPARLDKVLSAAEAAQRRLSQLEKRLVELDKRLTKTASGEAAPTGQGGGDPKLAARLSALEKQVAALSAAPAGKGGKPGQADPKLAGQVQGLQKQLKGLEQDNQKLSAQVDKLATAPDDAKLAAQVKGLEQRVAALDKAKPTAAKPDENTRKRLEALEKQMVLLARQPSAKGEAAAVVPPQLVQRVVGQGEVLSGVTSTLGKMEREQQRRDKRLEQRLAGLEKRLSSGGKATVADDQRLATLEKQVKALAAAKPGAASPAEAKLNQRVAELDKRLSDLAKADAKGDRDDVQRVAALEKELARVRKEAAAARQADPKLAARLSALEKKLAIDDRQEEQVDRRLDQLEKRVASVASRPAPAVRPAPAARPAPAPATRAVGPVKPQLVRVTHVVRPGQTLYGLARDYNTTLTQIKAWNPKLAQRNKILIGEKLVIYVKK